jgi:hypothetical protein
MVGRQNLENTEMMAFALEKVLTAAKLSICVFGKVA